MGNSCGTGWRALVKTAKEAAQNKNDKEMYRAQGLKQDVIEERKTIAGYSTLVFAHPKTDAKARSPSDRFTSDFGNGSLLTAHSASSL